MTVPKTAYPLPTPQEIPQTAPQTALINTLKISEDNTQHINDLLSGRTDSCSRRALLATLRASSGPVRHHENGIEEGLEKRRSPRVRKASAQRAELCLNHSSARQYCFAHSSQRPWVSYALPEVETPNPRPVELLSRTPRKAFWRKREASPLERRPGKENQHLAPGRKWNKTAPRNPRGSRMTAGYSHPLTARSCCLLSAVQKGITRPLRFRV